MDQRTRKRDAPDTEDELKEGLEPPGGLENGLQAWGYDPSHYNYNLGTLMSEVTLKNPSTAKSVHSEEMRDALRAFPPRTITDALVQNFIQIQVYHYSPIYAPTFLDSYARWWQEKTSGQALSPEFTCLLLRILACSAQYLAPAIKKKVEYELSESPQVLTESYDRAAKRLSDIIVPGTGGLDQVIQLFLVGSWMKSEGLLVESWHALSDAIRDAQELGMHKQDPPPGTTEFEIEMRERIWCLLYVWDWQMSKWLARPRIIDYTGCAFGLPKLKIDESNVAPGLPSMFAHVMYQGQLVRILDKDVQPIGSVYTADQIHSIQRKIGQWMADFPAPYQVEKPDTQFDHDYPYVPSQRYQLHAIGFMLQLDPCRSYLTRYVDVSNDTLTAEFRAAGIDKCLNITKAARSMYEWEQETNAKAHLFAFALFDTATILCSAVLHDKDNTLTRREEVLGAIKTSLETLELVGKKTKLGAISYGFLAKLVNTLKIFDGVVPASATPGPDGPSAKRAKTDSSSGNEQHSSIDSNGSGEGAFVMVDRIVNEQQLQDVIFTSLTPQDWQGTVERGMTATNFNTYIDSMDMAELEQVWNWDTQNFDVPDGLI